MNRVALPLLLLSALAFTTACKDPKREAAAPVESKPAAAVAGGGVQQGPGAPAFRPRSAPVPLDPAAPVPAAPAPAAPAPAQAPLTKLDVTGQLVVTGVKAAAILLYVSKDACDFTAEKVEHFGSATLPPSPKQPFFLQVAAPRGATAHVCVVAIDDRRNILAEGTYEKNPVTLQDPDGNKVDTVQLTLRPMKVLKPLPKGL